MQKIIQIINPLLFSFLVGLGLTFSVNADDHTTMEELLDTLYKKGTLSEAEYQTLLDKEKQRMEDAAKLPKFSLDQGKFEIKSANGEHKFRIGGRLNWDVTFVGSDGNYTGTSETQFRRVRLYFSGTAYQYFDFKFQFDFEDTQDSDQAIEDAYIRYTGLPVKITLGQRESPYSLAELTSSKYIAFIERSMVSEFFNSASLGVGNRNPGITFSYNWKEGMFGLGNILAEGGYYFLRTPAGAERDLDDGHGITGRLVWSEYDKTARNLLSLGISGGYRTYPNGSIARIRVRPGVSEGDRIVDTDADIAADFYSAFNINFAGMYKRAWLSAEYFRGGFNLIGTPSGDNSASGAYFQGGVFLTNDSRRYKKGVWDSVKPSNPVHQSGIGAWEVAFRVDELNLGNALHSGSNDEEGSTLAIALNWYPINNFRIQANYVSAECDSCDWSNGDPDFFILRTQIFF